MLGYHEPDNVFPVLYYPRGFGHDRHVLSRWSDTGGHDPAAFHVFDQAEPAGSIRFKVGVMAEPRYFNSV
jgi:hypothetical protein